jgi:hypothetical protein
VYSEPEARATGRAGWLLAGSGHARDDFLLFVECTLQHLGEGTVSNAKPAARDVRLPAGAEQPDLASTGRRSPWHQVTMSHDFVYRHWKRLGGYKDLDHHIKFRMSDIQRHLQRKAKDGRPCR